jgi:hypothetical protein
VNSVMAVISDAIAGRRKLSFQYHSLPRVVEPMCLGEVGPGTWQLRAHQVGGKSSSSARFPDGKPRLFEVDDMVSVAVLPDTFEIPAFYTRGDSAFVHIAAQL